MVDSDQNLEVLIKIVLGVLGYQLNEAETAKLGDALAAAGFGAQMTGQTPQGGADEAANLLSGLEKLFEYAKNTTAEMAVAVRNAMEDAAKLRALHAAGSQSKNATASRSGEPPGHRDGREHGGESAPAYAKTREHGGNLKREQERGAHASGSGQNNPQSGEASAAGRAPGSAESQLAHSLATLLARQDAALSAADRMLAAAVTRSGLLNEQIARMAALLERIPDPRIFEDRLRALEEQLSELSHRSDRPQS